MDDMPALTSEQERRWLAECAELAPEGIFVELGPWMGATTAAIARVANVRRAPFVTVDRFTDDFGLDKHAASSVETLKENLVKAGVDPLPRIVVSESSEVPDGVEGVAFLFIDTSHNAETVFCELDAWLPLMVPGAVLVFHDYGWDERYPDYTPAIDRRLAQGDWELLEQVGYMAGFRDKGERDADTTDLSGSDVFDV